MPHNVQCKKCYHLQNDWCSQKVDSPDPDLMRDCQYYRAATNFDRIKELTADEFADIFWNILDRSKWYTNSRVWLKEWLKQEGEGKI